MNSIHQKFYFILIIYDIFYWALNFIYIHLYIHLYIYNELINDNYDKGNN